MLALLAYSSIQIIPDASGGRLLKLAGLTTLTIEKFPKLAQAVMGRVAHQNKMLGEGPTNRLGVVVNALEIAYPEEFRMLREIHDRHRKNIERRTGQKLPPTETS